MYKNKQIIIFTLILSLLFLMPVNTVSSLEVGDIILVDWESANAGTDSGTTDFITYQNDSNNEGVFEVITIDEIGDGSKSLYVQCNNNDHNYGRGYINLTSSYDYINKISIGLSYKNYDPISTTVYEQNWTFYDSGETVLKVRLYKSAGAQNVYFQVYDVSTGWHTLKSYSWSADYRNVVLNITHIEGNTLNYTLYSASSYSVLGTYEGASATSSDWVTFDSSYIYSVASTWAGTNKGLWLYIDDIIINTNEPEDDVPEITGISCSNCCNGLLSGSTRTYTVDVYGDDGSIAYFRIIDPAGSQRFLKQLPKGQHTFDVTFPINWGLGNFTCVIFDQSLLFFEGDQYYSDCEFEVYSSLDLSNYTDMYGGFFAEFYTDGSSCYYNIGDDPTVVFYLNDTYIDTSESPDQKYGIYIYKTSETDYENWLYGYEVDSSQYDILNTVTFGYGQVFNTAEHYIIRVFNMSFSGFIWELDTLVYESEPILVCDIDVSLNKYTISTLPDKAKYKYDEEINVIFNKEGSDMASYRIISPTGITVASGLMNADQTTANISIDFSETAQANAIGKWTLQITDRYGSPSDYNAKTEYLTVDTSDAEHIFPPLDNALGGIVGLIVTLFLTLSPLIIAGTMNNQLGAHIQIPPLTYAITGGLGVVISTIFGWFPAWVLFFIIGLGIIVIILMYLFNQKGASA